MSRAAFSLAALAWLVIVLGGGALLSRHDASVKWSPGLRLAGVDLIYALRRVAAESDRLLLLDEIRPGPYEADLSTLRVDIDLPSAPLEDQLAALQHLTGNFEFRIDPDLIYVRSYLSLSAKSNLDLKVLRGGKFTGNIRGLAEWLRTQVPNILLASDTKIGQPIFRQVELQIPPRSSVLDLLTQYARAANWGWRLARAGQKLGTTRSGDETQTTFLTTVLSQWQTLDQPYRIPPGRDENTTLKAIAQVSQAEGIPVAVIDRSPIGTMRGHLDMLSGNYPRHLRFPEVLARLAGRAEKPNLRWVWSDGVAVVSGNYYDFHDQGVSILGERLHGGHFRGSLGMLARWINQSRMNPSSQTVLGGEILPDDPIVEFDIADGATVQEALEGFSRSTGTGWVFVADEIKFVPGAPKLPGNWSGGSLSYLTDWLAEPDWSLL